MQKDRNGKELHMAISVIKKRDGRIVPFDVQKISEAIQKSFRADEPGRDHKNLSDSLAWEVYSLLDLEGDPAPTVEHVQDIVEQVLMRNGYSQTAKSYILYRQARTNVRNREAMGRGTVSLQPPRTDSGFITQALTVYAAVRDNGGCERLEGFYEAMGPGVADEFRREYTNLLRLSLELTACAPVAEQTLVQIDRSLEAQGLLPALGANEAYLKRQTDFLCGSCGFDRGVVEQAQQKAVPMAREIVTKRARRTVSMLLAFLEDAGCARELIAPAEKENAEAQLLREIVGE